MGHPAAILRDQVSDAVAFGLRMREARRTADMDLAEGATALGFDDEQALDAIERGQAVPSLRTAIVAAQVFGTTTDYLCGLTDDSDGDRDRTTAIQRHIEARITADIQRLTRVTVDTNVALIRAMHPTAAEGRRLARLVIEAGQAVAKLRALNPTFDEDVRGGASVLTRFGRAVDSAVGYLAKLDRATRNAAFRTAVEAMDQHTCQH